MKLVFICISFYVWFDYITLYMQLYSSTTLLNFFLEIAVYKNKYYYYMRANHISEI